MGAYKGKIMQVLDLHGEGHTAEEIAEHVGLSVEEVKTIIKEYS
jgi:DNA-binding NarL/FixJ family response regulator